MSKKSKKLMIAGLNVLSVVAAIGIVYFASGRNEERGSGVPFCNHSMSSTPNCSDIVGNLNDKNCLGTYNYFYTPFGHLNTKYFVNRTNVIACSSCSIKVYFAESVASAPEGCTAN